MKEGQRRNGGRMLEEQWKVKDGEHREDEESGKLKLMEEDQKKLQSKKVSIQEISKVLSNSGQKMLVGSYHKILGMLINLVQRDVEVKGRKLNCQAESVGMQKDPDIS